MDEELPSCLRAFAGAVIAGLAIAGGSLVASLPASAAIPQQPINTPVACTPGSTAATQCPNPPIQPGGLDHFLCYRVLTDQFTPPPVVVLDQFHQVGPLLPLAAASTSSDEPNLFCNPVEKTLNDLSGAPIGPSYPVSNPQAHLYCFVDGTSLSPVGQNVQIQNQFGLGNLVAEQPTRLCVPSWKYDPNANPQNDLAVAGSVPPANWTDPADLGLNHFQCYKVSVPAGGTDFPGEPATVTLHDQFGTYLADLGAPTELCAPAIKTVVDGNGVAVGPPSTINSDGLAGAHLLCFAITNNAGNGHGIVVGNQFSVTPPNPLPAAVPVLLSKSAVQLCLPSFKTLVPPILPEAPFPLLLPLIGAGVGGAALLVARRRTRRPRLSAEQRSLEVLASPSGRG